MKKSLLLSITALAVLAGTAGLASCSGGSTSDSSSTGDSVVSVDSSVSGSEESENSSTTTEETSDVVVTRTNGDDTAEVEVGETITLRFGVSSSEELSDATVNITCSDESVVELPNNVNGITSCRITGLAVGTCTITATAVADPAASYTVTVTVTEANPSLSEFLTKLDDEKNFTLTATTTYNDTNSYTSYSYLTEDWLVQYDEMVGGGYIPAYNYMGFKSNASDNALLGIFVDESGRAAYIEYEYELEEDGSYTYDDETGNLQLGDQVLSTAVKSASGGLLNADNFDGYGSSSPNDYNGNFNSLRAIDPDWVTSDKESDNTYEIEGTENDYYACYAEYYFFSAMNPGLLTLLLYYSTDLYYSSIAAQFDTVVTINSQDSMTITITWGDYTVVGEVSNIGTTTAADVAYLPTLASDVEGKTVELPSLISDYTTMDEAFRGDNYVQVRTSYDNENGLEYNWYVYYADEYLFIYWPEEYMQAFENENSAYGEGFYIDEDDVVRYFQGSLSDDLTSFGEDLETGYVTAAPESGEISDVDFTQFVSIGNYYTNNPVGLSELDFYYYFSDTSSTFWSGDDNEYYTSYSPDASEMLQRMIFGYLIEDDNSDAITQINIQYDELTNELDTVNFRCAWPSTQAGYYSVSDASYNSFGQAETHNPLDAAIDEIINGTGVSEGDAICDLVGDFTRLD